jgi:hypothetical protein
VFTLDLGTVEGVSNDYNVHFANDSNGVVQVILGSSDAQGLLTVELDGIIPYLTDKTTFTVWVTAVDGQLHDNVPFDYGAEEPATCATVSFEKVFGVDGFPFNILEQILIV